MSQLAEGPGETEEDRLRRLNKERKPREFDYNKLVPLVYIPALSLLRFGLRGRVDPRTRDFIFGGAVLGALAHAGYVMGKDTTM